jgi:hypothetical protein
VVLKLNSSGVYQWHTFYGSSAGDYAWDGAVDGSEGVYIAGYSYATWQGDDGTAPLYNHSGGPSNADIAILKLFDPAGADYHLHLPFLCSLDSSYFSPLAQAHTSK